MRRSAPGHAVVGVAIGAIAFAVYAATAARTITWWDGSHYPLLARTLGITNPPGSLLLTLLGWAGTRVAVVSPVAFQLNLWAAVVGAVTAGMVASLTARLAAPPDGKPDAFALWGGVAAGLALAFAFHVWTYATQFTPYILTTLFTALILAAFLKWWERAAAGDGARELFVLALLFGFDVSVHRTNLLWLPAVAAGVLLRRPRVLRSGRCWAGALAGGALGLALQLGYIVLSRRGPWIDICEPRSLVALLSFERMDSFGGGFLINLWPRRADPVHVQLADWLAFLWRNLGTGGLARATALTLAIAGVGSLASRKPRLAVALLCCFLAAGLGGVLYFNRPVEYFRPLDRHYMPSWVLFAPWIGLGLAAAGRTLSRRAPAGVAALSALAFALALGVTAFAGNRTACDRSRTRIAEDFARDALEPLAPRAILVTNGDNDTFPLWYMQVVEGVRPDVLVVNLACSSVPSMVRRYRAADPAFAALEPSEHVVDDLVRTNAWRRPLYLAVTLDQAPEDAKRGKARLEGLSYRVHAPGDSVATGVEVLERFVHERLPRALAASREQVVEPEIVPLLTNYLAAGFQLASQQAAAGDPQRCLATLDALEGAVDWARMPGVAAQYRTAIAPLRAAARAAIRGGQVR